MQVFVFDSKQEQLKAFNDRIADFFEAHPCASVTSEVVDGLLCLVALGVEDLPMPHGGQVPIVTATVRPLTTEALENRTNALIEQVQQAPDDPDEDAPLPIDLQIRQRRDKPGAGWIILVACVGISDVSEEGAPDSVEGVCPHCGNSLLSDEEDVQALGDEDTGVQDEQP